MKQKDAQKIVVTVIVAMVIAGAGMFFALGGGRMSIGDRDLVPTTDGPWRNSLVHYNLLLNDKYTGDDVNPTVKVYNEMPSDWNNPRGTFDRAVDYSIYTVSDGEVTLNRHLPGTYYLVVELAGYNTEFVTIEIPDGTGRGIASNEYNQNPDSKFIEMTQVGVLEDVNVEFTITTNSSNRNLRHTELLTVAEDTEFRGWKVIVKDKEELRVDTSGNGVYDLGIKELSVQVGGKTVKLFEPSRGIDLFDSRGEYTFEFTDVVRGQEDLIFRTDVTAITGTGNVVGELNPGQDIVQLRIFDAQGTVVSTINVATN